MVTVRYHRVCKVNVDPGEMLQSLEDRITRRSRRHGSQQVTHFFVLHDYFEILLVERYGRWRRPADTAHFSSEDSTSFRDDLVGVEKREKQD